MQKNPKAVPTAAPVTASRRRGTLAIPRERARTPTKRRTQESRSRQARDKLLKATIKVLIERGYAGLTTKEVAAAAGMSSGALMHHYSTKAELVIAAGAYVYDQCIESGRKIATSAAARKDPLNAFIVDCTNVYLESPFIAAVELLIAARTDPLINAPFDAVMQNYRRVMNDIWLDTFMKSGMSRKAASFLIMSTLNLIRGMGVNSLWQKNVPYYRSMLREWTQLARAGSFKGAQIEVR